MGKATIIIAIYQLGSGGVSAAVRSQMRLFSDKGHPVVLATLNHEPQFLERFRKLQNDGFIPVDASARNIFIEAAGDSANVRNAQFLAESYDFHIVRDRVAHLKVHRRKEGRDTVEVFFNDSGEIASTHVRNSSGVLTSIQENSGSVLHTEHFKEGVRFHKESQRCGEEFPYIEQYFASDGYCFMTRTIEETTGHGTAVFHFERETTTVHRFAGIPSWQTHWLQNVVDDYQSDTAAPIVIAQAPSVIPKVAKLNAETCIRIGMLHNNHNAAPYSPGSELRSDHEGIFASMRKLDSLVVLTETQQKDIVAHHDSEVDLTVIPNIVLPRKELKVQRASNRIGVVAILDPRKQLDHVIRAFQQVVVEHPSAELVIWGRGKNESELKSMVQEQGLGGRVLFEGYVTDVDAAYQSCAFTVLTSKSEGFPYSIAESSLNETPVIAYDCPFGPADMIHDGSSGYVIEQGNIQELVKKMLVLLKKPLLARKMGESARQTIEAATSAETVYARWDELFSAIRERQEAPKSDVNH